MVESEDKLALGLWYTLVELVLILLGIRPNDLQTFCAAFSWFWGTACFNLLFPMNLHGTLGIDIQGLVVQRLFFTPKQL